MNGNSRFNMLFIFDVRNNILTLYEILLFCIASWTLFESILGDYRSQEFVERELAGVCFLSWPLVLEQEVWYGGGLSDPPCLLGQPSMSSVNDEISAGDLVSLADWSTYVVEAHQIHCLVNQAVHWLHSTTDWHFPPSSTGQFAVCQFSILCLSWRQSSRGRLRLSICMRKNGRTRLITRSLARDRLTWIGLYLLRLWTRCMSGICIVL